MLITDSDAAEVIEMVTFCHRRTAPRLDDPEAAKAMARVWARMFNAYKLSLEDLLAAVEKRALTNADAPEPAEIIEVARAIRRDRSQRWDDEEQADYEAFLEAKSEGRVGSPQEWAELKAANRNRLSELINPITERKGLPQ
jgi:hypothetical protein